MNLVCYSMLSYIFLLTIFLSIFFGFILALTLTLHLRVPINPLRYFNMFSQELVTTLAAS